MSPSGPAGPEGALPLTGERTIPGLAEENYWFRRHEVVYQRLADRCAGRDVLEAGCGEGYGADLIADVARRVIGLDYDEVDGRPRPRTLPAGGHAPRQSRGAAAARRRG